MIEKKFCCIKKLIPKNVKILVVSKNQSISSIKNLYNIGQKDFGENYVQEIMKKYNELPKDIRWHMIGRIQSNKLKYLVPFIHLIHSIQKTKHIKIINDIGYKYNKIIKCLIQIRISNEINKSGISEKEADKLAYFSRKMKNVKIIGLMGMASFKNMNKVNNEFMYLHNVYNEHKKKYKYNVLSMGMSRDFKLAIKHGSTMLRLGNTIFNN